MSDSLPRLWGAMGELTEAKRKFIDVSAHYYGLTQQEKTDKQSITFGIQFAFDKADILPEYHKRCSELADQLNKLVDEYEALPADKRAPNLHFEVVGHTCDMGTDEYNLDLSDRRAKSVKAFLESRHGRLSAYLGAHGEGERHPLNNNENDLERQANRRVELEFSMMDVVEAAPSREGINSMELIRGASVLKELDEDKAYNEVWGNLGQMAIGIMAITPAAPIVAIGAAVVASYDAMKTLGGVIDEAFLDSVFEQKKLDRAQLLSVLKSSSSNIELMTDYEGSTHAKEGYLKETTDQYRLRAEAVNGLFYLLVLSAVHAEEDSEIGTMAQSLQIAKYIENFILNDQWVYRPISQWVNGLSLVSPPKINNVGSAVHRGGYVRQKRNRMNIIKNMQHYNLGLYWAHVVTQAKPDALKYWRLDKDYSFLPADDQSVKPEKAYGTLMPCLNNTIPTGYTKANFQNMFSVHMLSETDVRELAKHFRANWGDLRKSSYHFLGVFQLQVEVDIQEQEYTPAPLAPIEPLPSETNPFPAFGDDVDYFSPETYKQQVVEIKNIQWMHVKGKKFHKYQTSRGTRRRLIEQGLVFHDTPIAAVIVLGEDVQTHVPVTVTVKREDVGLGNFSSLMGPEYKAVATRLTAQDVQAFPELRDKPELWEGKYGCIIQPFYQHGTNRIEGLKPMASKLATDLTDALAEHPKRALNYYARGHLSNMDYRLRVELGNKDSKKLTGVDMPLWGEINGNEDIFDGLQNSICTSLEITGPVEHSSLLNREFLASSIAPTRLPELFGDIKRVTPFVRFFNGKTPTPIVNQLCMDSVIDSANRVMSGKLKLSQHQLSGLTVHNFDWDTPMEFVLLFSTDDVDKQEYKKLGLNWRNIPGSFQLANDSLFADESGPKLDADFIYCGELEREDRDTVLILDDKAPEWAADVLRGQATQVHNRLTFDYQPMGRQVAGYGGLFNSDKRYLYMAKFTAYYESPKGKPVNSIRPFGEKPLLASSHFDFYLKSLVSSGNSGLHNERCDTVAGAPFYFKFDQPDDYYSESMPWCEPNEALAEQYADGETKDFLLSKTLTSSQLERWLEDQAAAVKFTEVLCLAVK